MTEDLLSEARQGAEDLRGIGLIADAKLVERLAARVREAEEARDVFAELNRIGSENAEAVRKERDALAARVREAEAERDAAREIVGVLR